jgi:AraC family transcriptional regulator of adaptative response / DNA-3-methyladenine glycosylase II
MAYMNPTNDLDDDARYRALCAHDARFDGRFFVAVRSTGIYCRPICRVRTPRRENCRFYGLAAQAEQAGYRPCLRCRPELAPLDRHWSSEDAGAVLVQHATRLLDAPRFGTEPDNKRAAMQTLSARLGVSDRHLRRVFEQRLGVSPLQYLLTRRLLAAKQLLADTALPVSQVALASGFASLRRFNAAFFGRYGLDPTQMRRGQAKQPQAADAHHHGHDRCGVVVRLAWRPPLDARALMHFLSQRQLPGLEHGDPDALSFMRTLSLNAAGQTHAGWLRVRAVPEEHHLRLNVSDGLLPVLPSVIWRVREVFDLDADPARINASLHADFPEGDGLRVPGCFDGFELAVRAVLGQQVTVAAARTLATRLLHRFGTPLSTPVPALNRLFPTPHSLATADPAELGQLGIVRQRQAALQALARAVAEGTLELDSRAPLDVTLRTLESLPGIGPWTAQYIAMRALRWPDAWPSGDVALHHALGLGAGNRAAQRAEASRLAARWQPWRSYAVIRAWARSPAGVPDPAAPSTPLPTPSADTTP